MKMEQITKIATLFVFALAPSAISGQQEDTIALSMSYYYNASLPSIIDVPNIRGAYGGAKIIPVFNGEWDPDQECAFRAACQLWEEVMPTTLPITIKVEHDTVQSNFAIGCELSRIRRENSPYMGGGQGEPNAPYMYYSQQKAVYYKLISEGLSEFAYGTNPSFFLEPEITINYHSYANKSLRDIYSFSKDPASIKAGQLDFITCAMRDIGKGLGIDWNFSTVSGGKLRFNQQKMTPFEMYTMRSLSPNKTQALALATQGDLVIYGKDGASYRLYAPTTWDSLRSLKYFIPNDSIKVSKLLSWDFGAGFVIRDISDQATNGIFENLLGWNYLDGLVADGSGSYSLTETGTSTANAIPYGGTISLTPTNSYNRYLRNSVMASRGTHYLYKDSGYDTWCEYDNMVSFHPNYRQDGSTNRDGRMLALLLNNGMWDIIYDDGYVMEGESLMVSPTDITLNYPDSAYAKTYDGRLRGRYTFFEQTGYHQYHVSVKYFIMDDLPQPVKMRPRSCRFIPAPEYNFDEYTGLLFVPIDKTEGATRISIAQYDEWDDIPYVYDVPNVKDNYFTAIVDKEFTTTFVITSYNANGSSVATYTYDPMASAQSLNLSFERSGNTITIKSKSRKFNLVSSIKSVTLCDVSSNRVSSICKDGKGVIDISALRSGNYVINVIDIKGHSHIYKFSK